MTFEQANRWAIANSYGKNDKATEAFGIKYYSSICESCGHQKDCFFYDSLTEQCNFYQSNIEEK